MTFSSILRNSNFNLTSVIRAIIMMALVTIIIMVLTLNLVILSWLFLPLYQVIFYTYVATTFLSISSVLLSLTLLYYFHYGCKLLGMTWSIVEKKTNEFKTSGVVVAVAVAVVAWVSITFSPISSILPLLTLLYHLYRGYKLLGTTWYIVEKKTDKFKTSRVPIAAAVPVVAWVSITFSSISFG